MARRLAALLGNCKDGPLLYTADFPNPKVLVKGLVGKLSIESKSGSVLELIADGTHPIPASDTMKFRREGEDCSLICLLLTD